MKINLKKMIGVTLLEILLVLVVAALVLVMSIRYYQSASTSAKVNASVEILQSAIGAADAYINAGKGISTITDTALSPYFPGGVLPTDPWSGQVIAFSNATTTSYDVSFSSVPGSACTQLATLAQANSKIKQSASTACAAAGATAKLTFTIST